MYTKLQISGTIEILTGMHIGGSLEFSAIGAVDSPVVRDTVTNLPVIPGSSLKGKLRYLLSRKLNDYIVNSHSDDGKEINRVFGSSEKNEDGRIQASRIQVSDMVLANQAELEEKDIPLTEVKFENTISRQTAIANPRQIERVVKGSIFHLDIIYNCEKEDEIKEDIQLLKDAIDLLRYDFLGGHGSRGYGRVRINHLEIKPVVGELDTSILEAVKTIIEGA